MGKIRLLNQQTINEIAAGEVVERPASVVKELIENSIDAGAEKIEIRVEEGGRKRIEIIDDGEGMSKEDALLSIKQHATSKLMKIEDLSMLSTYGFRGEALSSIASISKLTIRTRTEKDKAGTLLITEFGSESEVSSVGAPVGTTIVVDDIFANVPARRKNLATAQAELAQISNIVTKYAIAWPEIGFDLVSNDHTMYSFRGSDRTARVAQLVGPRSAKSLLEFLKKIESLEIRGALTKMEVTKSSPSSIYLFVNRRPVVSSVLLSAIADGYGTRLMRGRYPVGYLMIDIPPEDIDVNVHPTKKEIRFLRPDEVRESVLQAITDVFKGSDATPSLGDIMSYTKVGEVPEKLKSMPIRPLTQAQLEMAKEDKTSLPPLIPMFQLFDTYIVAKGVDEDSVVILDQHAAAERISYEKIMESLKQGDKRYQKLLSPALLELTASEKAALEENLVHLDNLGFEIEEFGGGSYRLLSVPVVLGAEHGENALKLVLDDISKAGRRRPVGEDLIWKVACHGSVRAGESLAREQMNRIISELFKTENPYTCEHGRPTMISLKRSDFERLFKRQL